MARTLTVRLDDETAEALGDLERERPDLPTSEIIRDAIGARSSVVYFLRRSDGAVKIGYSASLKRRIAGLSSEYGSLVLEAVMPGGRREEALMHERLDVHRIDRTEWFRRADDVDTVIAELRERHGDPGQFVREEGMRVNVTFEGDEVEALAKVMAAMPARDESGRLRTIGPADAIRWAVTEMAKRGK